ncbi:Predicted hydrolase/acyltransferase (alpha/beta hydrolase superfamily) [Phaffia rhodozyma]|uniref:Predicted hydrolase/acyltransferase (Alpha/beta hydrolase superfamily) n=1 Tax=Phaffia rhodozyma TaxID=264483 RepID=A0A0F7SMR0_PHARH|nr:Predicted hydrolase/acyltransferase (alpha/beta hydrolase superfamily) [Phaffia rhodozyma]
MSALPTNDLPDLPDERSPHLSSNTTSTANSSTASLPDHSPVTPSRPVPTTYGQSLAAWWSFSREKEMSLAEERLLRRLPSFIHSPDLPDPTPTALLSNPLVARLEQFPLSTQANLSSSSWKLPLYKTKPPAEKYLHGLKFYTVGDGGTKAQKGGVVNVLLHGYGAALGFFFLNLQAFGEASASANRRAFALDWLGMGLSSRPSPKAFNLPSSASGSVDENDEGRVAERVKNAEDFFVESLEEWRKRGGWDKMVLCGHSLGGYLSAAYTLKYPSRVEKLILISPAGIPINPNAPLTPSKISTQGTPTVSDVDAAAGAIESELSEGRKEMKAPQKNDQKGEKVPQSQSAARSVFGWAWEKGWSPFSVVRSLGPLAPKLIGAYSSRRFEGLSQEDIRDMHAYIYATTTAKGSGEYCIHHLLAPGAFARKPLVERMDDIKIPVKFVYGHKDWMDFKGGVEACRRMQSRGNRQTSTEVVERAGHHVYLDNPERMNEIFWEELGNPKGRSTPAEAFVAG